MIYHRCWRDLVIQEWPGFELTSLSLARKDFNFLFYLYEDEIWYAMQPHLYIFKNTLNHKAIQQNIISITDELAVKKH